MGEPSSLTETKPVSGYPRQGQALARLLDLEGPKRCENVGGHRQRPPGPLRLRITGHGALTRDYHAALGDRDGAGIEVHIGPPQSENSRRRSPANVSSQQATNRSSRTCSRNWAACSGVQLAIS